MSKPKALVGKRSTRRKPSISDFTARAEHNLKPTVLRNLKWTKELARSFWSDLAGSEFLEEIAFSRFASGLLVDIVEPYLRPTDFVFDFGGGDNLYLVRELLRRGYQVGCYEPYSHIKERNADLDEIPNYRGSVPELQMRAYDCLFFSEVIEHLEDTERDNALSAIESALKPRGLLVVTTPDSENLFTASRYCPVCRHLFHPWGHVRSYTAETLEHTLNQYGFKYEELHTVDFSEFRHAVEERRRSSLALATLAQRMHVVLTEASVALDAEQLSELQAIATGIVKEAGTVPVENQKRRRIGFGGTLVGIFRKDR